MENVKKTKKKYESDVIYTKKYNKLNLNVQLNRSLLMDLKSHLSGKKISMKSFIENLIRESLK